MAAFSLRNFIAGLTAATSGQLQGQMLAEQELQRRQQQTLDREEGYDRYIAGIIPQLDDASRQKALAGLTARHAARARGQSGGQVQEPLYQQFGRQLDQIGARTGAPATSPVAPMSPVAQQPVAQPMVPLAPAASPLPPPMSPDVTAMLNQQQVFDPNAWSSFNAATQPPTQQPPMVPAGTPVPAAPRAVPLTQPPGGVPFGRRPVTPPAAPSAAPPTAPPPGRSFDAPGFGTLTLRGVDPKQAEELRKRVEEKRRSLRNYVPGSETEKSYISGLLGQPIDLNTEEGFKKAEELERDIDRQSGATGAQAQRLQRSDFKDRATALQKQVGDLPTLSEEDALYNIPLLYAEAAELRKTKGSHPVVTGKLAGQGRNIEAMQAALAKGDEETARRYARLIQGSMSSKLSPSQEQAAISAATRQLGAMKPEQANDPDVVRRVYANLGVAHLLEGLPSEALQFGGDAMEKRWDRLVKEAGDMGKKNPAARRLFYSELVGAARLMKRQVPFTEKQLGELDPVTQAKMTRDANLFDMKVSKEERDQQKHNLEVQKLRNAINLMPTDRRTKIANMEKAEAGARVAKQKADRGPNLTAEERNIVKKYLDILTVKDKNAFGESKFRYDNAHRERALAGLRAYGKKGRLNLEGIGLEDYSGGTMKIPDEVEPNSVGGMMKDLAAGKHLPTNGASGEEARKRATLRRLQGLIQKKLGE